VVIDTPPVTAVTDAVVLSSLADAVVLVARANETPRQLIRISVDQLKAVKANILGAILNGVSAGRDSYYYYQYHYSEYLDEGTAKRKRVKKDPENSRKPAASAGQS